MHSTQAKHVWELQNTCISFCSNSILYFRSIPKTKKSLSVYYFLFSTYMYQLFVYQNKDYQYIFCFKIHVFWGHSCIVFFWLSGNLFCISLTCNQGKGSSFKRNEWKEAFHSRVQSALHLKSFFFLHLHWFTYLFFQVLCTFYLKVK